MLDQQQFQDWFRINGVDIDVAIPMPLIGRLFRRAVSYDTALFAFLGQSCFTSKKHGLLILKFQNWNDAWQCYSQYAVSSFTPKA